MGEASHKTSPEIKDEAIEGNRLYRLLGIAAEVQSTFYRWGHLGLQGCVTSWGLFKHVKLMASRLHASFMLATSLTYLQWSSKGCQHRHLTSGTSSPLLAVSRGPVSWSPAWIHNTANQGPQMMRCPWAWLEMIITSSNSFFISKENMDSPLWGHWSIGKVPSPSMGFCNIVKDSIFASPPSPSPGLVFPVSDSALSHWCC